MRPNGLALVRTSLPVLLLATALASGSTIRHDRLEETYINYGDTMRLVGGVSNGLSFGSGVVIGREWVLTAAHVVTPVDEVFGGISFETDADPNEVIGPPPFDFPVSGLFGVTDVYVHEYYDQNLSAAGGFDIALLKLDRPVDQYTPWKRLRGNPALKPELGRKSTAVGFGCSGTGLTGYDPNTGGFVRMAGDNMLEGLASDPRVISQFVARDVTDPKTGKSVHFTQEEIASQFMLSDFDAPAGTKAYANPLGSADPLDMEACVAPGDSGGPVLVDENGEPVVAGLNSWILGLQPPDGDGVDDATYGDLAGYLRVAMFNDWIDEVMGVPEPGALTLLLLCVTAALLRRGRRLKDGE